MKPVVYHPFLVVLEGGKDVVDGAVVVKEASVDDAAVAVCDGPAVV